MEHNRKQKLLVIIALIVGIASLSVGFAAFSVSLNISSSASVTPNSDSFNVVFSLYPNETKLGPITAFETSSNAIAKMGVVNNYPTPVVSDLLAIFDQPGQYVEYKLYIRNEGAYNAYLNNINYIGEKICTAGSGTTDALVQSACEDINITVKVGGISYDDTTPITGHALATKAFEEVIIRLEYDSDGTYVDGAMSIAFPSVSLVYSTIDDSSMKPAVVRLDSGDLNTPGSVVSIGNENFYVIGQENGNVKLLSMYNLYVGYSVDSDWNFTELNSTGLQDSNALGSGGIYPFIGMTPFSSDDQKGINYSDYNGSIIEEYVNNYKEYLMSLGVNVSNARLIFKEELDTLGCSAAKQNCYNAPSWVSATSYWTGSASTELLIWIIDSYSYEFYYGEHYNSLAGVRPVIEIPLSEFE